MPGWAAQKAFRRTTRFCRFRGWIAGLQKTTGNRRQNWQRREKKTFQRRRIFALSAGQAAGLGAPCKKLPEERYKHMAKASGLLDFRGLRGAAPVLKGFASCAEAVRAPGKNGQFAGRSNFRDACRHSGEVSQTPSEAVCRPANAPIPPKFQTFCGAGRRFRNASQKAASEAA